MNGNEYTVTGKAYSLNLKRFQGFIHITLQERVPRGITCREVLDIKAAKRLVKYLEAVIVEAGDFNDTESK